MEADVVIVGTGVAGLFHALHLPENLHIIMITKEHIECSDSYLAQGGICVLKNDQDYGSFYEDTMRAGHYENNSFAVEVMIKSSQKVINELLSYGVEFQMDLNNNLCYTKEGAHSEARILYHKDITGKEITSKLLEQVRARDNITLLEYVKMTDLLCDDQGCRGIICSEGEHSSFEILARDTILATGGVGGLYQHSTNYPHLTGDSITLSKRYKIAVEHLDYVQFHPTTLYSSEPGRRFLISESVRGEGAVLLNKNEERFVNELLPRDVVTGAIREQMRLDEKPYVWLSLKNMEPDFIRKRFPHIYKHCLKQGYDITKQAIPVVPAQHYFMGGIKVDMNSKTSMEHLYAIGETSCNGVHGANRLASNSLLESLVFAKRAATHVVKERMKKKNERYNKKVTCGFPH